MFDLGKALTPLILNPAKFKLLWTLLDDKDAIDAHFKNWTVRSFDEKSGELVEESISKLDERSRRGTYKQYVQEISEIRSHYSDMLLVAAYTHLEDIVSTFFYELFLAQPKLLVSYIKDLQEPLTVPLTSFIENDKGELLAQLAKKNSTKACNGEIGKVCKRIKKIADCDIPKNIQLAISELQDKRNRVVHEAATLDSDLEEVEKYYGVVNEFLILLARAAQTQGITVYDPAYLITEMSLAD